MARFYVYVTLVNYRLLSLLFLTKLTLQTTRIINLFFLLQGLKFRVYFGAIISLLDMYTDIEAIVRFFKEGNDHFAYANIVFVWVSLCGQLLTVYAQNRKRGMKSVAYESLIVLCMIKPAIDAKRVASGAMQEENTLVDPQTEATATKIFEMFGESIPSSVLQTYALIGSGELSAGPVTSIAISCFAIAYTSTQISIDMDTNPSSRLKAPSFYGYCPDNGRLNVMILMIIMTASHVLMKVIACSLMLRLSSIWFMFYVGGDLIFYFLYKIVRGDLRYWFNLTSIVSWAVSIIQRIVGKTIVDFTLLVHFRHPFELGGIYWSLNIIVNQLFCFVSLYLYTTFADTSSATENVHNSSTSVVTIFCNSTDNTTNTGCDATELPLQELVSGLFILSMLAFLGFLKLINKEYLWTFFDRRTGSQFVIDKFHEVESNAMKFDTFSKHRSFYKSIEDELKTWFEGNWERWEEEEKEDWFNAAVIATVPEDYLPKKALSDMGGVTGRKASIIMMKEEKGKVGRESVRRGSDLKVTPMG